MKENRRQILKMLRQGSSTQEICETMGCCVSHVQHIASAYGIERRRKTTIAEICRALALMVYTTDNLREISDKTRLHYKTVREIKKKANAAGFDIDRPVGRPRKEQ